MTCPNCGGPVWDNRERVAQGWKGPITKCKDKECAWVKWAPKGQSPVKASSSPVAGPKWTWASLGKTYERCLLLAEMRLTESELRVPKGMERKFTTEDLIAATATLFITAAREGVAEPRAKLPPMPEPEPVEPDEDDGGPLPF